MKAVAPILQTACKSEASVTAAERESLRGVASRPDVTHQPMRYVDGWARESCIAPLAGIQEVCRELLGCGSDSR